MRSIEEIRLSFQDILASEVSNYKKNLKLVDLMEELEKNYNTFIISPTQQELDRKEVRLYNEISLSRVF